MHTDTHKLKASHQRQCCAAACEGDVTKLLCIHQNHLILNHWSGPCFTPLFRRGKGKSKNSLWASVPRSLSMFSQSGSISEFRWASCSSHRFCVSCTVTDIGAAMHTHTQPCMHNTHYTLKHVPAITHTQQFAPGVSVLRQWVGKLSQQPPQYLTSQFIDYCHQHIHHPLHPISPISLPSSLPHPVSFCPSSSCCSQ